MARDNPLPLLKPLPPFETPEEGRQHGLARMAAVQASIDEHNARLLTKECVTDYLWCSRCCVWPGTPGAARRQGLRL